MTHFDGFRRVLTKGFEAAQIFSFKGRHRDIFAKTWLQKIALLFVVGSFLLLFLAWLEIMVFRGGYLERKIPTPRSKSENLWQCSLLAQEKENSWHQESTRDSVQNLN